MLSIRGSKTLSLASPQRRHDLGHCRAKRARERLVAFADRSSAASGDVVEIDRGLCMSDCQCQAHPEPATSRRVIIGGAWMAVMAVCTAQAESNAASSSSKKSSKKKPSGGSGTGPSLTKNQEKLSEKNEREAEFQERMARIRAGGAPSF